MFFCSVSFHRVSLSPSPELYYVVSQKQIISPLLEVTLPNVARVVNYLPRADLNPMIVIDA